MSNTFAKIFEDSENGQALAVLKRGDDGPEIRWFIKPESLGVCEMAMGFSDTEEGWDKAEMAFENLAEKDAAHIRKIFAKMADAAGDGGDQ